MSGDTIIKKKKIVAGDGHHGGAWKVAYADFVTAMMAFFLLMWLLNATTEDQRKGIADYFDPSIPISRISAGGSDVLSGDSIFADDAHAHDGTGGSKGVRGPSSPPVEGPRAEKPVSAPGAETEILNLDANAPQRVQTDAYDVAEILRGAAEGDLAGQLGEHLIMRETAEGLVIEIVDQEDQALFAVGSATPSTKLRQLMEIVAEVTSTVENNIAIVGHTDALAYSNSASYSNWELSSDRALAARRLLVAAGTAVSQIVEVAGKASSEPLLEEDPFAPQNRRISITLLRN